MLISYYPGALEFRGIPLSENKLETDIINEESLFAMKYANYVFIIGMIAVLFAGVAAIATTTPTQFSAAQMSNQPSGNTTMAGNTTTAGNATTGMNTTQNTTTGAK